MSKKTLAARLTYDGGDQLGRINKQKLRSLYAALKNDYQSRLIKTPKHAAYRCLINNDVAGLKADYDKKYISVDYASQLEPGDVFECLDDNTHWMIYLPVLTETAYLRSEIIRCRYTLTIGDDIYWIYFQGPTETDLRWQIKRGINYNELNLSGTIYIKHTPETREFFERFTHIKVDNHIWEVQVTDSISVPGILELEVQEYYDNTIAELPKIIKQDDSPKEVIVGETLVPQDTIIGYYIPSSLLKKTAKWTVSGNNRVKIQEVMNDGNICKVRVYDGAVGTYTVSYGDYSLEVIIDWQREQIKGPTEVAPYGTYKYHCKGVFSVDSDLVKIIEQDGKDCIIEVLTGKKGKFNLTCATENYGDIVLPVKIKSLTGGGNAKDIGVVS